VGAGTDGNNGGDVGPILQCVIGRLRQSTSHKGVLVHQDGQDYDLGAFAVDFGGNENGMIFRGVEVFAEGFL